VKKPNALAVQDAVGMFVALNENERRAFVQEGWPKLREALRAAGKPYHSRFHMTAARLEARRNGGLAPKGLRSARVRAKHFDLIIEATCRLWPRHMRARQFSMTTRDRLIYAELAHETGLSVTTIKRAMKWLTVK
jgi:hypothetical protein